MGSHVSATQATLERHVIQSSMIIVSQPTAVGMDNVEIQPVGTYVPATEGTLESHVK